MSDGICNTDWHRYKVEQYFGRDKHNFIADACNHNQTMWGRPGVSGPPYPRGSTPYPRPFFSLIIIQVPPLKIQGPYWGCAARKGPFLRPISVGWGSVVMCIFSANSGHFYIIPPFSFSKQMTKFGPNLNNFMQSCFKSGWFGWYFLMSRVWFFTHFP